MSVSTLVSRIIEDVKRRGDSALCAYAKRFDKVRLSPRDIRVTPQDIAKARRQVSSSFLKAIQVCARQVEAFALNEKKNLAGSWRVSRGHSRVGQWVRP